MKQRAIFPKRSSLATAKQFPTWILIGLMAVAVFLHVYRLDGKLYWHDEVYTSLRAAGYNSLEVGKEIFSDRTFTPQDLLTYQTIKPDSTPQDTINSLATEDPQHPPLYFLIDRGWMQVFGSSITASRSLAVLFSLLALPVIYRLSLELFASPLAAWFAALLLAFSPFDILFAQLARQYSLLTLFTVLSSWLLLRAIRLTNQPRLPWGLYAIAAAGGLYTQPFFGLTLIAQGVYVLARQVLVPPTRFVLGSGAGKGRSPLWPYLQAMGIATVLYAPWLWVMLNNFGRALATTSWAQGFPELMVASKFWLLSFTALFFDLDFGFDNPLTFWVRVPYLVLIGVACYGVYQRSRPETWLFIAITLVVPFLLLVLPDLLLSSHRSLVSRYLIPCYPAVQLAVGYWLAEMWHRMGRSLWLGMVSLLLVGSLTSILVSAHSATWWNRIPSYFNAEMATQINTLPQPLLISDPGNDGTNLGDLISLSYLLDQRVPVLLLHRPSQFALEKAVETHDAVLFRPSEMLKSQARSLGLSLEFINAAGGLLKAS